MKSLLSSKRVAATVASLSCIVAFGAYGTYSAFSDTTSNDGNTFAAGTIKVTDDDAGNALFSLAGLLPGDSSTKCINVANAGTSPFATMSLSGAASGPLAAALKIDVDRGTGATGGSGSSCAGFSAAQTGVVGGTVADFPTAASPVIEHSGWGPGATKSYRVTVTLDPNAAAALQGKTGGLDLTWTASS